MPTPIHAYFKSENDAESANAALQRLRVKNITVEEIPESGRTITVLPIFHGGGGTVGGTVGAAPTQDNSELSGKDNGSVTHLLEGEVEESDYDEATRILSENNGYARNES
ncbi:hypothetical protein [Lentibacillus sediminis]|uniref:hypothetical protein n=1 Tax=Lentibacillus sediminis TaxID=1940529 RepID=UPI000C1B87AD|nr:hypothetical protein [Lentibacillus sediminis]